jgi:hypothetical protein
MFTRTWKPLAFACAVLIGCSEPTTQPSAVSSGRTAADHSQHGFRPSNSMIAAADTPFTYRAPLNPLTIREPDFDMKLGATKEMTVQRVIFPPGPTIWHTHPATSFVLVVSGAVKLERVIPEKGGGICVETPVFNPNQTFIEAPNRVHRAVVQGTENAELLVVRFNVPIGTPLTVAAPDPGC